MPKSDMPKIEKNQVRNVTRQLRLLYYNDYLLKCGAITQREHRKMREKIMINTRDGSDTQ